MMMMMVHWSFSFVRTSATSALVALALLQLLMTIMTVHNSAHAMYADEQGSRDWMREQLGRVTHSSFRKREMFGATESGAVFKLLARTGKVQWRQVLPGQESTCTMLLNKQTLFTLTSSPTHAHAYMWQATDGSLLWDRHVGVATSHDSSSNLYQDCDGRYAPVDLDDDGIDDIVVLVGNSVSLLSSAERGEPFWRFAPDDSNVRLVAMHVGDRGQHIYAVGVGEDSVWVFRLSTVSGEQTGVFSVPGTPRTVGGSSGSGVVLSEGSGGDSYAVYVPKVAAGDAAVLRVVTLEADGERDAESDFKGDSHDTALSELLPASVYANKRGKAEEQPHVVVSPVMIDQSRPGVAPFFALEISSSNIFPSRRARHVAVTIKNGGLISVAESYPALASRTMSYGVGSGDRGMSVSGKTTGASKSSSDGTTELAFAAVVEAPFEDPSSSMSVRIVPGIVENVEKGCSASLSAHPSSWSQEHGALLGAFVHAFTKRDGFSKCRVLVVSSDWHFGMMSDGSKSLMWEKAHEAIADIEHVEMINYDEEVSPLSARESSFSSVSYMERLSGQLDLVGGIPGRVISLISMVQDFFQDRMNKSDKRRRQKLTASQRSAFGFSKLIIGVARSGKIIALHAETGDVAWSRYFPGLSKNCDHTNIPGRSQRRVFVIRAEKSPTGLGSELLVLHQRGEVHWTATWLDGQSGENVRSKDLPFDVSHTMLLPRSSALDTRILVVLDPQLNVHTVPDTSAARREVSTVHKSLFLRHFSDAAGEGNVVQGFGLADAEHAVQRWSLALPAGSRLVDWASVPAMEAVASPAHQQGNDGLLIKYLNPHLVAIAALNEDTSSLLIYLVDSVTGHIVRQYKHKDAAQPVHIVRSENWVFCSYWNLAGRRTEISSIALFEGEVDPDELNPWSATPPTLQKDEDEDEDEDARAARSAIASSLYGSSDTVHDGVEAGSTDTRGSPAQGHYFSSFSASDPVALQKTFVFPTGIKTMQPTLSKRGITNKHILVGMQSDQILLLNRLMLDPRRPIEAPTDADKKEGLFMYSPIIQYPNAAIITYTKRIPRLSIIRSYPAELESTTLVIGVGLDMFYARTNPSKGFDLMPDDFSYAQLMLICSGLSIAVWWARSALQKKKLAKMWA